MELKIKVKPDAPALEFFSAGQLDALSRSFTVKLAPGDEVVHFSTHPPFDTRKRWQPLDSFGAPTGTILTFNGIDWT